MQGATEFVCQVHHVFVCQTSLHTSLVCQGSELPVCRINAAATSLGPAKVTAAA